MDFILDNYGVFHKKEAWSRRTSEVSGAGGPGFNSPVVLGRCFESWGVVCLGIVFGYVEVDEKWSFFFL